MGSVCAVVFFQAEDGIRDTSVTGVQTCALPICPMMPASRLALLRCKVHCRILPLAIVWRRLHAQPGHPDGGIPSPDLLHPAKIGRASCRERGESSGAAERYGPKAYQSTRPPCMR